MSRHSRKVLSRLRSFPSVSAELGFEEPVEAESPDPELGRAVGRMFGFFLLIAGTAAIAGGFLAILDQPVVDAAAQSAVPMTNPRPVYAWLAGSIVLVSMGGLVVALAKARPGPADLAK